MPEHDPEAVDTAIKAAWDVYKRWRARYPDGSGRLCPILDPVMERKMTTLHDALKVMEPIFENHYVPRWQSIGEMPLTRV